jgi:hypothetical protein
MSRFLWASPAILVAATSAGAQQWTAIRLHPDGHRASHVHAVTATAQGGYIVPSAPGAEWEAGYWSGSAAAWVRLSPPGVGGEVRGIDETRQVGLVGTGIGAVLWYGTPESRVDLRPPATVRSGAVALHGDMQVGGVGYSFFVSHAALWRGTAASFVDLHPPNAHGTSSAVATDGVQQGGEAGWFTGPWIVQRATIWSGTAESYVDLRPGGTTSRVEGMASGVQVGWIAAQGTTHAALWYGTPDSYVDLNPPGWSTLLLATTGTVHVGTGGSSGFARALVNFGTRESWFDLHQFLPPQYTSFSEANSVYQVGRTLYIGGSAESGTTGEKEAILWIGPVPCYANCDQSTQPPILTVEDFSCFINRFASAQWLPASQQITTYANCDGSTVAPVLNVEDFSCFINAFAQGCH